MKQALLILGLVAGAAMAHGQIQYPYVLAPSVDPSGACGQAPQLQTVYSDGKVFNCNNGTWTQVGGGGGTVTSVTGTANQIDVATGTTTPVISLDPALILPTGAALSTPASGGACTCVP